MSAPMLEGRKILITGPAGQIAFPMARALARRNEVWGIARFSDPASRKEVEDAGIRTLAIDLGRPDFSGLPRDFTHLLHLAAAIQGDDYDGAIRTNAEGTGLLLSHCRGVEAALVMSTVSVYKPHPDPWHLFREDDPLGDIMLPFARSYSISKIAEEGVARFCAREFGIPITIARMGASYGPRGGLPIFSLQALAAGKPVATRFDPCPYSPIHDDDMLAQVEAAAGRGERSGDHRQLGRGRGREHPGHGGLRRGPARRPAAVEVSEVPGASIGSAADPARRKAITGPCRVSLARGHPPRARRALPRPRPTRRGEPKKRIPMTDTRLEMPEWDAMLRNIAPVGGQLINRWGRANPSADDRRDLFRLALSAVANGYLSHIALDPRRPTWTPCWNISMNMGGPCPDYTYRTTDVDPHGHLSHLGLSGHEPLRRDRPAELRAAGPRGSDLGRSGPARPRRALARRRRRVQRDPQPAAAGRPRRATGGRSSRRRCGC